MRQRVPASSATDGTLTVEFTKVPAGWFVIAVLHDADSNNEMATNALGIPKEGYGFSRNAKSMFGPPGYDKAALYLEPGQTSRPVINIK